MEPYVVGGHAVSHFDFYRFTDAHEWVDAGFRDIFAAPGLKLAEWPDNAAPMLPQPDWRLRIDTEDGGRRRVTVHALTPHGVELLDP
jgi:tRNA threonylcarbamoyladenosine biosynthesis protein TsaE